MAYNKSKHIDAAQKHLRQGKTRQAIEEYQQILKREPNDQVALMTLGDLYVREGETFQAIEHFERLAKVFQSDGFTSKAIAIYKKVAKLAPQESRIQEQLAELYVQQGVLSEARPLFLQLAEGHLKAGRQPQAAAIFQKLLEAEPDNLRVHTRLADLYVAMDKPKEAIASIFGMAQRLQDHGEHAEAARLADRVLQIDAQHKAALLLKTQALSASGKSGEATELLESLSEQDRSDEITLLLFEQYVNSNEKQKAAALSEKVFTDSKNFALALRAFTALLEAGELEAGEMDRAQALLALIRDAMTESGEHEALAKACERLVECRPKEIKPLEWLVDLFGKTSDSFRLPDALAHLAQAHESAGDDQRALETYEQLLERRPEDETTRRKYVNLRKKAGLEPLAAAETPVPVKLAPTETKEIESVPPPSGDPALEEETQRFVTQALTDADLFSSYGLTQKAIDLLESTLQRAPQHMPILERLLDLSLGAGNDWRTGQLAATLEQVAIERNDRAKAEKYGEFRRRFQRSAEPDPASSTAPPQPESVVPEFVVPIIEAKLDEPAPELSPEPSPAEVLPLEPLPVNPLPAEPLPAVALSGEPVPVEASVHEVDLSDEWAALSLELGSGEEEISAAPAEALTDSVPEPSALPQTKVAQPEEPQPEVPVFDLEPQIQDAVSETQDEIALADNVLADLATELESATTALGNFAAPIPSAMPPSNGATTSATGSGSSRDNKPGNKPGDKTSGPLDDVFNEFRSELSELGKEDKDLETHYNLGIAYREMGLLDEAISEFQKVAKANNEGTAFNYAMQCCTLLGLAFMEKGQPAVAAIWYERALQLPGLDQESVLALRYDLGVAQELSGETSAAFKTFSQVYAMNIDYRDVSERIALLGKTR